MASERIRRLGRDLPDLLRGLLDWLLLWSALVLVWLLLA